MQQKFVAVVGQNQLGAVYGGYAWGVHLSARLFEWGRGGGAARRLACRWCRSRGILFCRCFGWAKTRADARSMRVAWQLSHRSARASLAA